MSTVRAAGDTLDLSQKKMVDADMNLVVALAEVQGTTVLNLSTCI
jgi:hypothetical protein